MGACSAAQPVPPSVLSPKPKQSKKLLFHPGFQEADCLEVFRRFDPHNTGLVGSRSIRPCLAQLARYCEVPVPPDRLSAFTEELLQELDLDADGCLTWNELRRKLNPNDDAMVLDMEEDVDLVKLRMDVARATEDNRRLVAVLQAQHSVEPPRKETVNESAELLKQMVELGHASQKRHEEQVALLSAQIASLKHEAQLV